MQRLEQRAGRFSFKLVDIPVNTILTLDKDESITCAVGENNQVLFNNQIMSLSRAALQALHGLGYRWKSSPGYRPLVL